MIIGLTGKFAAGKGTVADVLRERGFVYHSLSDILREELDARGIPESRSSLRELGNELRREGGPGALARRLVERLRDGRDHIVDSIRNPAEVEELRRMDDFTLVAVDAEARVRFERLRERDRIGDPITWDAFRDLEARETASDDPTTQQLAATVELADRTLDNDGSVENLRARVAELVDELGGGRAS